MPNPTRDTVAGRAYNDLRNLARQTSRPPMRSCSNTCSSAFCTG